MTESARGLAGCDFFTEHWAALQNKKPDKLASAMVLAVGRTKQRLESGAPPD